MNEKLEKVLSHLDKVKSCSGGWLALCPAHDDKKPSLSIGLGDDSRVLLKCHAGCNIQDIVSAMGLKWKDLFSETGTGGNGSQILKTYDYNDPDGKLLYQVVRMMPKKFRQRKPDGKGRWIWNTQSVKKVLYRLPEIINAVTNNNTIYLTEGEKDCDKLVKLGLHATTCSGGAEKWRHEYNEFFRGAKVIILPDNDEPGKRHAELIAKNLLGIAHSIRILKLSGLKDKQDISDWLQNGGTKEQLIQLAKNTPIWEPSYEPDNNTDDSIKKDEFFKSDTRNAQRLFHYFGELIRYNAVPFKKWFIWDGTRWKVDTTNMIYHLANKTILKMYKEAADIEDDKERDELIKWAQKSEAANRKKDMIFSATSIQSIAVGPDELDCNPWLINTLNYTLDLSSGEPEPREHNQKDYITKISPVNYNLAAKCPKWEKFLMEIFPDKEEMIVFLKRAIGYTLSGDTSEQCLFFCYGTGANGKTVFLETMKMLFGEYAGKAPSEMIMKQRSNVIPSDIARMKGKRFVICSEIEENRSLAESRVKDLTGGDTIVARQMYGDWFEFLPNHKLWIFGNYKPKIRGDDCGIWRRMKIIPFTVTIPEEERIPMYRLIETFKNELSGILNWGLQGYLEFRERGLQAPDEVKNAVAEYRTEMDIIGQFIDENCDINSEGNVHAKELWENFKEWNEDVGERKIGKNHFYEKLRNHGLEVRKGAGNKNLVYGITIK